MDIRERFVVIFKKDGLDIEGVRCRLNEAGSAKVIEEEDSEMKYINDEDKTVSENVHIFYMEGPLLSRTLIRLKFDCFDFRGHPAYGDNGKYVLMPR